MRNKDVRQGNNDDCKYQQQKSYHNTQRNHGLITYWIFAGIRIILTFIPQTGYIHPDEFFQSIEVIAGGDRFDVEVNKPWEFNVTFPIRSPLISQLTVGIPYTIFNLISPYLWHYFQITIKTPYSLVVFPRLFICALSFISDYCLYRICRIYNKNYCSRLAIYASSYIMIIYATRTISNSVELILFALLIYYVSRCMIYSENIVLQSDRILNYYENAQSIVDRVKYYKLRASLPVHSLNHCFIIASITVIGIFNRPTFIAFALSPIFFWLRRGLGSRSVNFLDFHARIFILIACGIPIVIFMIISDSFYFGYLTLGEIVNLNIGMNNFLVTPLNFLKYNSQTENLSSHGLHSRYLHFFVNVPLLYNILGIVAVVDFFEMIYRVIKSHWLKLPRIQSIESLMTASIFVPIGLLSIFPHQEPRFIIPTLLPIVYLYTPTIQYEQNNASTFRKNGNKSVDKFQNNVYRVSRFKYCWWICNIVLGIFYGFIHQGGVLPLTSHIAKEMQAKPELMHLHLHTSYIYPVPTALLQLRNTNKIYISSTQHRYQLKKDFFHYEYGSMSTTEVFNSILSTAKNCDRKFKVERIPYRIYYAMPIDFFHDFSEYTFINGTNNLNFSVVKVFYPHISTEKLPSFHFDLIECIFIERINICVEKIVHSFTSRLTYFFKSFGLIIVRIQLSDNYMNSETVI
ncbi:hypothetical protein PV325_006308 [Microctonus aethiopoides]|nr:hypothetical protein PV325_006308 [Microctonus aethiopoides]